MLLVEKGEGSENVLTFCTLLLLTLPSLDLPAILALAILELDLRGTLRRVSPPPSSELER